jgi:hypothetical protein
MTLIDLLAAIVALYAFALVWTYQPRRTNSDTERPNA